MFAPIEQDVIIEVELHLVEGLLRHQLSDRDENGCLAVSVVNTNPGFVTSVRVIALSQNCSLKTIWLFPVDILRAPRCLS